MRQWQFHYVNDVLNSENMDWRFGDRRSWHSNQRNYAGSAYLHSNIYYSMHMLSGIRIHHSLLWTNLKPRRTYRRRVFRKDNKRGKLKQKFTWNCNFYIHQIMSLHSMKWRMMNMHNSHCSSQNICRAFSLLCLFSWFLCKFDKR